MINYYLLTKPGIIIGNLITVTGGFLLASRGEFHFALLSATLLGLALVMASACIFNNYIDRHLDQKMLRTRNRPFAQGSVSVSQALFVASFLGIGGHLLLFLYTNELTVVLAAVGFFIYVVLYSFWKRSTVYGTAIGSLAGSVPPLVGYCAVSNQFDVAALILSALLICWQMAHFFSIAIYHLKDYTAASLPVLPVKKGVATTQRHIVFYVLCFILVAPLLTFFHYTGYLYLTLAYLVGGIWLWLSLRGGKKQVPQVWARQMFRWSLVAITLLCFIIPFDIVR